MTHRIASVILLSIVTAARADAQTATQPPQPPSANAAADFPDEPPSDQGGGNTGSVAARLGMASASDVTAPSGEVEGRFRISTRFSAVGGLGFFRNLQPSTLQPYVDIAVAQMTKRAISVTGEAREPAQFLWGGVRFDAPTSFHVSPYVMAGAGWARSTPSARFTYTAGSATVNGGTASAGQDATTDVLSTGVFIGDRWSAMGFRWAAGLSVPVRGRWGIDGRYSWSRLFAPTAVTVQGVTAGLTFRF